MMFDNVSLRLRCFYWDATLNLPQRALESRANFRIANANGRRPLAQSLVVLAVLRRGPT